MAALLHLTGQTGTHDLQAEGVSEWTWQRGDNSHYWAFSAATPGFGDDPKAAHEAAFGVLKRL